MVTTEACKPSMNDELCVLIRAGDQDARTRFIETNLSLVEHLVKKALGAKRVRKRYGADVMGAARLALVEATQQLETKEVKNATAYIVRWIVSAIKKEITSGDLVSLKLNTLHDRKKAGKESPRIATEAMPAGDTLFSREAGGSPDELWEELNACCQSDLERSVIEGYAEGETPSAMAARMNLNVLEIHRARVRVRERYEERNDVRLERRQECALADAPQTSITEECNAIAA